jgi:fructose-specific phosphotransferase system IIA component
MNIIDVLDRSSVLVQLNARTKDDVLNSMIDVLKNSEKVKDLEEIRKAVFEREKIMSTGIGNGFALPHGKTKAVESTIGVFATLANPVDFKALDSKPVHLVFMLIGQEHGVGTHLRLLSRISRLMTNIGFRDRLMSATTPDQAFEIFSQQESEQLDK